MVSVFFFSPLLELGSFGLVIDDVALKFVVVAATALAKSRGLALAEDGMLSRTASSQLLP